MSRSVTRFAVGVLAMISPAFWTFRRIEPRYFDLLAGKTYKGVKKV